MGANFSNETFESMLWQLLVCPLSFINSRCMKISTEIYKAFSFSLFRCLGFFPCYSAFNFASGSLFPQKYLCKPFY